MKEIEAIDANAFHNMTDETLQKVAITRYLQRNQIAYSKGLPPANATKYTLCSPGSRKMHETCKDTFYWPLIQNDVK